MALDTRTEVGTARQMITADEAFSLPDSQELKRLDVACGQAKKEGFIGIDGVAGPGVDIVHDLMSFPWPIESGSIYEIHCSHFVEHIPVHLPDGKFGMVEFMNEVYRILMPGGTIRIEAPYWTSERAWQDPTHCRAITDVTFLYFNKKHAEAMRVDHYTGKCNFEPLSRTYCLTEEWESKAPEAQQWAIKHYVNVVADIHFVLRKIDL